MTTTEAIKATLTAPLFAVLRKKLAPPELLKEAALHCFCFPLRKGNMGLSAREKKIQTALLHLNKTGEFIE